MSTLNLPKSVVEKYKLNFMVRVPVRDESEEVQVSVDRHYSCYDCMDSGEVTDYYYDTDSHNYVPDGTKPCLCA